MIQNVISILSPPCIFFPFTCRLIFFACRKFKKYLPRAGNLRDISSRRRRKGKTAVTDNGKRKRSSAFLGKSTSSGVLYRHRMAREYFRGLFFLSCLLWNVLLTREFSFKILTSDNFKRKIDIKKFNFFIFQNFNTKKKVLNYFLLFYIRLPSSLFLKYFFA